MKNKQKGITLCLLSALAYSMGPILGKLLYGTGFPWQVVVCCRGMIPGILVLLYAIFFARDVFNIKKKDLPLFIAYGSCIALSSITNYCALYYIDAAIATVLLYTLPVFTVLLSRVMLKEPLTTPKIIATFMAFMGVILIIEVFKIGSVAAGSTFKVFGIPSVIFGLIIGLASGLFGSLFTIVAAKLSRSYSGWTVNSWGYFIAFPIFFVVGIPKIATFNWTPKLMGIIFIVALVGLTAYSLYIVCMQYIGAGEASLVVTLDPVFSVTMAIVILGETLTPWQFCGCILVLGGVVFMEKGQWLIDKINPKNRKVTNSTL
ncbi:MAG: DMT family transporter [Clostridiales bacterium]